MGYKGWVVLFDEGESIAQTRITGRSKSYQYLHRIFLNGPAVAGLYPIFAFTDDFFFRLKEEDYDRIRVTRKGESLYFDMNYAHAWKDLGVHRLRETRLRMQSLVNQLDMAHQEQVLRLP